MKPNNYIARQHQTKTITLCDNTKPNNYIVWQHQTEYILWQHQTEYILWQHQTEQLHCVTTCKNMILWQEDTAKK